MGTGVFFIIRGVKPNQLHSIWLRLASPSPLTMAPVTPLAPTWGIQTIINNANTTSAAGLNAFYSDKRGNALVFIPLDFRLSNGVYPFSKFNGSGDVGIGHMPFTFAVGSHCTDNKQHGLLAPPLEVTFTVSLN